MKKIAFLHPQMSIKWWAIKMLLLIWEHLRLQWNPILFYTFNLNRDNCFPELNNNLDVFNLNTKWINKIFAIIKLVFLIRKFDIIFAWNSPMHFVAVFAKILNPKLKIIWYVQNIPVYYLPQNKWVFTYIKRLFEKFIIPFIDQIFVNSYFIKQEVFKYYNKQSEIIYPSIDTTFFQNEENIVEEVSTLFTYSRLTKWKNIALAINAYAELIKAQPWLRLIIGWAGEELEQLQEMARFYPEIHFIGELDMHQIKENLERCTVFLFTSSIDAFWLSIIEAFAMEKPVVARLCWGSWEIIENWINGYVAKEEEEFVHYINELLQNSELRRKMWQQWREFVLENFSIEKMYQIIDEKIKII